MFDSCIIDRDVPDSRVPSSGIQFCEFPMVGIHPNAMNAGVMTVAHYTSESNWKTKTLVPGLKYKAGVDPYVRK